MPARSLNERSVPGTALNPWAPGPRRPRLADGAVHLWLADLSAVSDDLTKALSPDEHARVERFLNARDGLLWGRAHGVLRTLLGHYLQADPHGLRFVTGEYGKPALVFDPAPPSRFMKAPTGLSFNLSHSGHLALYGLTRTGAIGVDIEAARRPRNALAVAARALGAGEARRLEMLNPADRAPEFLRMWVRHEAARKCLGTGIAGAEPTEDEPWTVELNVGKQATAALALAHPSDDVRCFGWQL
jgi:4'-phosphopantetheinyl transferase